MTHRRPRYAGSAISGGSSRVGLTGLAARHAGGPEGYFTNVTEVVMNGPDGAWLVPRERDDKADRGGGERPDAGGHIWSVPR